ncbi:LOW QUALITY PROTEIN: four-jointed box protein 1-like [Haliotis rubra]|uniref:LOW QUALITY PROTEIN: four-jointed box protein 1-like n=1 Tax=Haliotis rubra TaxID=36100 RepID=UPI001EE5BD1B|nr:LOW QUALITY PROTEIN: four-jointed box protein 1-like [Haliotis rubra]
MRSFSVRRVKTLFLTIFSFGFCFVLLLNVMIHQLNSSDGDIDMHVSAANPSAYRMKLRQLSQQHDNNYIHAAGLPLVDRKPQAARDSEYGQRKGVVLMRKGETIQPDIVLENVKAAKDKKPFCLGRLINFLFPNRRKDIDDEYSYEEDIEKVVIQDEDEEDDKDEYEDDDIDPDEDYDEDAADRNPTNVFDNLKNSSKEVFTKPPLHFQEVGVPPVTPEKVVFPHQVVVDAIYWSPQVEQLIPKGMSNYSRIGWVRRMRVTHIKSLQQPSWDRCGRPKNGYVVMEDGTAMCARYRHPHDTLVLGEVLSFYLSMLLGMDNVPAVLLSQINASSIHWRGQDTAVLGWGNNQYVALIQWIDNMNSRRAHVQMPPTILEAYRTGGIVNSDIIAEKKLSAVALSDIVQWGAMVIFDYLTGNYDRVASMQDAAEKEKSPKIIQDNIRNLRKSTTTGKLWLIDNESGLLDAYDLLYHSGSNGEHFLHFHKEMLQTMCIFQKSLVDALYKLHGSISPHEVLEHYARTYEPLIDAVQKDATYNLFKTMFSKRLSEVIQWIKFCKDSHRR